MTVIQLDQIRYVYVLIFSVILVDTNPYADDGSPEIVHDCRKGVHFFEYQQNIPKYTENNIPKYITNLLKYYRKPYKFIEENSDFRLLTLLSKKIKNVKDGVLFDMEKENFDKNLNEININKDNSNNVTFGNVTEKIMNEILSTKDKNKNIVELNKNNNNNNKMNKGKEKVIDNQEQSTQKYKKDFSKDLVQKNLEIGQPSENSSEKLLLNNLNKNDNNVKTKIVENEWQEISSKKKKNKKQNQKLISDKEKNKLNKNIGLSPIKTDNIQIINSKSIFEEQSLTKLAVNDDDLTSKSTEGLQENSNETKSVDSKNTDQGKKNKKKSKGKEQKQQNKNKLKIKENNSEDLFYIKQAIKQNNREIQEKIQQQKKAEKEARIAKEIELRNTKNDRKENLKEKRKLKKQLKNKQLQGQNNLETLLPTEKVLDLINDRINVLIDSAEIISKLIDKLNEQNYLELYCLIDKAILHFFESIQKYFWLFNIKFELIEYWRFEKKFYEDFCNAICSISKSYPQTIQNHGKFTAFGYKFLMFYQAKGDELIDNVRGNIEKTLAVVLSERQKAERIISVEDKIG